LLAGVELPDGVSAAKEEGIIISTAATVIPSGVVAVGKAAKVVVEIMLRVLCQPVEEPESSNSVITPNAATTIVLSVVSKVLQQ
jgi:hypothetical protein